MLHEPTALAAGIARNPRLAPSAQPKVKLLQSTNRMIASRRPAESELQSGYQQQLLAGLPGDDVISVMNDQLFWMCELASHLCTQQVDVVHAPYTWTVRQVIEHCVNAERVFGYRMLRAAADDATPLSGWNENAYGDARFGLGTFSNLITELGTTRQSNRLLLLRIEPAAWDRTVAVDSRPITVRAMAWIAAAHLAHHLGIIEKRCQVSVDRHYPR